MGKFGIKELVAELVEAANHPQLVTYKPNGGTSGQKTVGVRTPYNKKFIMDLKKMVPISDRAWNDIGKEWVVDFKYYSKMQDLVMTHYGMPAEESEESVSATNPLAMKNQIALLVSKQWIEMKTPYDKGFVSDLKDYFAAPKWNGAAKRWKVKNNKENLSMASYLIKRYFKKAPEIIKA